jgi:hypothetical protein
MRPILRKPFSAWRQRCEGEPHCPKCSASLPSSLLVLKPTHPMRSSTTGTRRLRPAFDESSSNACGNSRRQIALRSKSGRLSFTRKKRPGTAGARCHLGEARFSRGSTTSRHAPASCLVQLRRPHSPAASDRNRVLVRTSVAATSSMTKTIASTALARLCGDFDRGTGSCAAAV